MRRNYTRLPKFFGLLLPLMVSQYQLDSEMKVFASLRNFPDIQQEEFWSRFSSLTGPSVSSLYNVWLRLGLARGSINHTNIVLAGTQRGAVRYSSFGSSSDWTC